MGYYYQLWILADVLMLFLAQFNVAIEYISTHNNDHLLAEYVYQHIQDSISKSMRERIGSMISGSDIKDDENKCDPEKEEKVIKLNLQSDIYSYTFYKFVTSENPFLHGELMIKCFLTITIQVMIIYLRFEEAIMEQGEIKNGTPELNCVKLACAFFMHLQLYPEIEISLGMIRFGIYN